MNSVELVKIIQKDSILSKCFAGVYAADQINFKISKRPCSMIINTDPSTLPGTHWIAVYFDLYGDAYYFDSFGRRPFSEQCNRFLKMNAQNVRINTLRLQSSDSYVCGMYCIYFLYFCVRHKSFRQILNRFTMKNYLSNDRIVCRFMYIKFRVRHMICV